MKIFDKLKKIFLIAVFFGFCLVVISCSGCQNILSKNDIITGKRLYCVSYNAQTFFDAIEDGREFAEFKGPKSKWNAEFYSQRLNRLKEVGILCTEALGGAKNTLPDIFVLQEIESKRVVEDFSKRLTKFEGYEYAVFIPPENGANFSTVLFSKYPVSEVESFYLSGNEIGKSILRPLVKAVINIDTEDETKQLTVFNVHWKSKRGGAATNAIRRKQEKQLFKQIQKLKAEDPNAMFLICGDFNQTLKEFTVMKSLNNCWNFQPYITRKNMGLQPEGSFSYRNDWEDIDHFFYSKTLCDNIGLELVDFSVIYVKPLIKSNGKPYKFSAYNGRGYSDHLPIGCVLEFVDN